MSFYRTYAISLGASQSGLSLAAQLYDYQGIANGSSVTTGFNEVGLGCYTWHGLIPDNFEGYVKFSTSGGTFTGAISSINKNDNQLVPYIIGTINDATPASGSFLGSSNLSSANNFYTNQYLAFVDPSGNLDGIPGKISNYAGSNKQFTFSPAFPTTPSSGDRFIIIGRWQ